MKYLWCPKLPKIRFLYLFLECRSGLTFDPTETLTLAATHENRQRQRNKDLTNMFIQSKLSVDPGMETERCGILIDLGGVFV